MDIGPPCVVYVFRRNRECCRGPGIDLVVYAYGTLAPDHASLVGPKDQDGSMLRGYTDAEGFCSADYFGLRGRIKNDS